MPEARGDITPLLDRWSEADSSAEEALISYIYAELHRVAVSLMRHERRNHTLQPTVLVHDAYMKLRGMESANWSDRGHFFRTAARIMRHILVDHARRRWAQKRIGDALAISLEMVVFAPEEDADVVEVDEALAELAKVHPRQAQVVEMRFFAGLSEDEIAEALGLCRRTVGREWDRAQAWLHQRLRQL
jgi:RNA polymerase sigma factor (TIGR02999 family)